MATKEQLYEFFSTGAKPSSGQFAELIDAAFENGGGSNIAILNINVANNDQRLFQIPDVSVLFMSINGFMYFKDEDFIVHDGNGTYTNLEWLANDFILETDDNLKLIYNES